MSVDNPTLAFNLTQISDHNTQHPFLDLMKVARPWNAYGTDTDFAALQSGGYLDEDGWPISLPVDPGKVFTIWAYDGTDTLNKQYMAGTYVLTYEGEGSINMTLAGVSVTSSTAGRMILELTGEQFGLEIIETDPNSNGNYIKNIKIFKQEHESLVAMGEVFNPDWLEVIQNSRQLRFMDWMRTNYSTLTDWADRPKSDDYTWGSNAGAPVEVMVQLSNQIGADPWFTMPHLALKDPDAEGYDANDDYIKQFAIYVRDNLDPDLVAHVETSNELWNPAFSQSGWVAAQPAIEGWSDYGYYDYVPKLITKVAVVWNTVFGEDAGTRLNHVFAWQTVSDTAWHVRIMEAAAWEANEPGDFVDPATIFDVLAVTTYFGTSIVSDVTLRGQLLDKIDEGYAAAASWLTAGMVDAEFSSKTIPDIVSIWAVLKSVATTYGLDLMAYEGGQHLHHSFSVGSLTQNQLDALTGFFKNYVVSQEMADLYAQLWDAWAEVSDGPFMQFGDVAKVSDYGSWGALRALGDTTPRATFMANKNAQNSAWFGDGGGSRYAPKIVKALTGGGRHRVEAETNGCTIDGDASGETSVIMPGAPADYTCARDETDTALYTYTHTSSGKVYKTRNCQAVGWLG